MRDLLVFLAMHPHGVRRDAAVAALWPDTGRDRPRNNLSSLISRLRSTIRATVTPATSSIGDMDDDSAGRIVVVDGELYRLDPDFILVDYWTFLAATATSPVAAVASQQRNGGLNEEQLARLHDAHALYRGPLADGIDHDWILSTREAARRAYLAATARLVRHHVDTEPAAALHILETARNHEPTNEAVYRDIIALQLQLGDVGGPVE
jgi:DNA-binding SARP family transcriptional activator